MYKSHKRWQTNSLLWYLTSFGRYYIIILSNYDLTANGILHADLPIQKGRIIYEYR